MKKAFAENSVQQVTDLRALIALALAGLVSYFISLVSQTDQAEHRQAQVQGGAATLRREGRHRAVLGRAPGHAVANQIAPKQVITDLVFLSPTRAFV